MIVKNIILSAIVGLSVVSCASSVKNSLKEKYCGVEITPIEVIEISNWSAQNLNVYDVKNGSEIYSEINDSIRYNIPDSIIFELFLTKLTKDEVVIDSYLPPDKELIEKIACILMNTQFSNIVPEQRKIRFFSYSNPDGSGDSPFKTAITNVITNN